MHYLISFVLCFICHSVANVSFDRSAYGVDEDNGPAQPVLVLSNPLSTDIIVQVNATDGSATGQYLTVTLIFTTSLNVAIFIPAGLIHINFSDHAQSPVYYVHIV